MSRKKTLKSSFGTQVSSRKESMPIYGFGTSTRDTEAGRYISPEHASKGTSHSKHVPAAKYNVTSSLGSQQLSQMRTSEQYRFGTQRRLKNIEKSRLPGPGQYPTKSSLSVQVESTKPSASNPGFGSSTRDSEKKVFLSREHEKSQFGSYSPGPATYKQYASVGKQVPSTKASLPTWKFGSEGRFMYDYVKRASALPGAGQYEVKSGVGKQSDSKKSSTPQFGFGSCERVGREKMFISADHEKSMYGVNSPGPGSANPESSLSKQWSSKHPTGPSWGFGTSSRFKYNHQSTPAPGQYD